MIDRAKVRVSSATGIEPVFPLHDHAQMLIVQQQDFHRQLFAGAAWPVPEYSSGMNRHRRYQRPVNSDELSAHPLRQARPKPIVPKPELLNQRRGLLNL
jgi:hypothetical protein